MGLFDEQVAEIRRFIEEARSEGSLRELEADPSRSWPEGPSLILEDDTALELGNPRDASLTILLWTGGGEVEDGAIHLVGPDVPEAREPGAPFAQVLLVGGTFADEYECFRDLRDAVYDTKLEGFMTRTMPSRQSIWCKVSREALDRGFSLSDLGSALAANLKAVEPVTGVEVLFVTSSREDVAGLADAATGAHRVVDAMMKMYQEQNFDCETCEYKDVCESVEELRVMRKKLVGEKAV